ncbi:hypothetical protein [Arthrobacter sp. Alg241-R88]|jgi:hypothetical protein|uniref:hypothetical protein n=1 Tax=Arthrobacter sp. Alg241-R88 TaxID=2305984 RepID=UPI0013D3911B|nr:hypothetical protein [Arthrobacter sp. Alg241-R88]
MVDEHFNAGSTPEGPGGLTERDLRLGKRAVRLKTQLCAFAFLVCVGIAIFVFLSVPIDTRMPYEGRFNRSGAGIPVPAAMLPSLILLFLLWRSGAKPDSHHMGKGSRIAYYILAPVMILGCVVGQWTFARSILEASGFFAG